MSRRPPRLDDHALGMDRPITRRDFLNGIAVTALAANTARGAIAALPQTTSAAQDAAGYYPPLLTGMRGSHPGSFEAAHAERDGRPTPPALDTGEDYDLIVVGAGLSGLAAAHFYRARMPTARVLVLDNHDDFGGHAKRNEFNLDGSLHLMNGGTLEIDSPRPYSPAAAGLLTALGIDVPALARRTQQLNFYEQLGLRSAVFFDAGTFGSDRLVAGLRPEAAASAADTALAATALNEAPLSARARAQILQIMRGHTDFMHGASSAEKKARLSRMSYEAFLRDVHGADPAVLQYYHAVTMGEWGLGTDAVSALDCWGFGMPGFDALRLAKGSTARMSFTPAGYADTGGSYRLHFPDGNATIARLLVRNLIPAAVPGRGVDDIVTARVDYGQLDRPAAAVRLRLNSIVTRARHLGAPDSADRVEITYVRGGKSYTARARSTVLAGYNMMIPYLCPELPAAQREALHSLVKTPLVYTSVALRNWQAFANLKVHHVYAPGSYHAYFHLNPHVRLGAYRPSAAPSEPILLHMVRTPCSPGLPEREQHIAGRKELMNTPFETFERNIRDQLGRTLGGGGFDPARDISAITVNRWPHGYAQESNPLFDPELPEHLRPHVIGRARFGRIAIANSDAGGTAYTDVAIDQGHRAVMELLQSRKA